jgi:hypothetical protein
MQDFRVTVKLSVKSPSLSPLSPLSVVGLGFNNKNRKHIKIKNKKDKSF